MVVLLAGSLQGARAAEEDLLAEDLLLNDELAYAEEAPSVADPLEPVNRVFFQFNDRLYFWFLKPVARAYGQALPADFRLSIKNGFQNLLTPVRVVNNLLQGKPRESGIELARFLINSTLGLAGLGDPAKDGFGLVPQEEDLGQTLGVYGLGAGLYLYWPILGPSNLRDTVGVFGDSFLSPLDYLIRQELVAGLTAYAGQEVNRTSFVLGEYEKFKEATFDPYVAVRDAYQQYRRNAIQNLRSSSGDSLYESGD